MAVSFSARRSFSLLDHHGPWCGWCLKTILPNQPKEVHHVLPTEAVRKLLRWDFRLPWTIPAHHACHREQLQLMSGGLSAFLQRALTLPGPSLLWNDHLSRFFENGPRRRRRTGALRRRVTLLSGDYLGAP